MKKWPVTRKILPFDNVIMQRVISYPAIRDIRRRLMPYSFERISNCPRFINVCSNLKDILLPCYRYRSVLPCIGLRERRLEELFEKYVVNEIVFFLNTVYHITNWWRYKDYFCVYDSKEHISKPSKDTDCRMQAFTMGYIPLFWTVYLVFD